jgi:hypothetical protein
MIKSIEEKKEKKRKITEVEEANLADADVRLKKPLNV